MIKSIGCQRNSRVQSSTPRKNESITKRILTISISVLCLVFSSIGCTNSFEIDKSPNVHPISIGQFINGAAPYSISWSTSSDIALVSFNVKSGFPAYILRPTDKTYLNLVNTQTISDGRGAKISPSGQMIAYFDGNSERIRIIKLSKHQETVADVPLNGEVAWSPDETHLAIAYNTASTGSAIGLFNIATKQTETVFETSDLAGNISWSPDGDYLAYSLQHRSVNSDTLNEDIYLLNLKSSSSKQLTQDPDSREYNPVWLPDSKSLLYVSAEIGHIESGTINMTNLDGTKTQSAPFVGVRSMALSPDGTKLVVVSWQVPNYLYLIETSAVFGSLPN